MALKDWQQPKRPCSTRQLHRQPDGIREMLPATKAQNALMRAFCASGDAQMVSLYSEGLLNQGAHFTGSTRCSVALEPLKVVMLTVPGCCPAPTCLIRPRSS